MNLQGNKLRDPESNKTKLRGAGLGIQQLGVPLPHIEWFYLLVACLWFTGQLIG